jgi:hypothetical protein
MHDVSGVASAFIFMPVIVILATDLSAGHDALSRYEWNNMASGYRV